MSLCKPLGFGLKSSKIRKTSKSLDFIRKCLKSHNFSGIFIFHQNLTKNHFNFSKTGDPYNHPVVPWVVDFSSECNDENDKDSDDSDGDIDGDEGSGGGDGWRNLRISKFRSSKGDHQTDHTFLWSPQPHHITEVLSSLTYFVYFARRTSRRVLQKVVRSRFEPKEYPLSMAKLYRMVPEECIAEFYRDPLIFESIIDELPDLELPEWCPTPSAFIEWHRNKLEHRKVSKDLHFWIDLNFGYKLGQNHNEGLGGPRYHFMFGNHGNGATKQMAAVSSIEASIEAKNVPLQFDPLVAKHQGLFEMLSV